MQTDFGIRNRGSATVLSKRAMVRLAEIGAVIGASFQDVYGVVGPTGAASGEPFIVYHGGPGEDDAPFEIEICAPIGRPIAPPTGWELTELAPGAFASVLHVGPYEALGVAYDALEAWIGRAGYAIAGPPREVYLSEPATPPAETRTVVEFPVVTSGATVPVGSA